MTLTVVGGGLVVETRPEAPSVEDLEALLDDGNRGEGLWHAVLRVNGVTGVCGARLDRSKAHKPLTERDPDDCPHCDRIITRYLASGIWEGFGRRPGRESTSELRWEWGFR